MKKYFRIIASFVLVFVLSIALVGCGKKEVKIKDIYLKSGTVSTIVLRGEQLDFSDAVVVVKYSDNTQKEVTASDLTFSDVDTSTVGKKTLTITWGDESFDVTITVVATEEEVLVGTGDSEDARGGITQLDSNLITEFKAKRNVDNSNIYSSFIDKTQPLYVGDDNKFDFRIEAAGVDVNDNFFEKLTQIKTNIVVELKNNGGTFDVLTGDDLTNMVDVDTTYTTLDFTEDAIGKTFRVTVSAENAYPGYEEFTQFTTELVVVDGWNVYDAKDLCLYDNAKLVLNTNDVAYHDWSSFRTENGYRDADALNLKGLVLQADIFIESDDVPSDVFWNNSNPNYLTVQNALQTKGLNIDFDGTPIDYDTNGVYHRILADGETFDFIGNYFQINLSRFPKMVIEHTSGSTEFANGGYVVTESGHEAYMTAHLALFYSEVGKSIGGGKLQIVDCDLTTPIDYITHTTEVNWKNINFYGNGTLNNDPANSGAIILMKNSRTNFRAYNTLMNNFYIGYFLREGNRFELMDTASYNNKVGQYEIDSCKGYNSYQDLFYMYGADHVIIKNSEFMYAGGPAIIADQFGQIEDDVNSTTGYISRIDIINSNIESKVTASSPWFAIYGTDSILGPIIAGVEQLFNNADSGNGQHVNDLLGINSHKTLVCDTKNGQQVVNIVGVLKTAATFTSEKRVQGYIKMWNSEQDYNNQVANYFLDMRDSTHQTSGANFGKMALSTNNAFNAPIRIFQTNTGEFANSLLGSGCMMVSAMGTMKAEGFKKNLNDAFEMQGSDYRIVFPENSSLNDKKEILKTVINNHDYINDDACALIYTQAYGTIQTSLFTYNFAKGIDYREAILNTIDSWADSYGTGNYLSLYTELGLGAVFGLYNPAN